MKMDFSGHVSKPTPDACISLIGVQGYWDSNLSKNLARSARCRASAEWLNQHTEQFQCRSEITGGDVTSWAK